MNFKEYQKECKRTATFWGTDCECLSNMCMGIAGEAGEIVDYFKKVLYQGRELDINKVKEEMGDLLWYMAGLADRLNIDLDEVTNLNIQKLQKRYPDGFSIERSLNREEEQNG